MTRFRARSSEFAQEVAGHRKWPRIAVGATPVVRRQVSGGSEKRPSGGTHGIQHNHPRNPYDRIGTLTLNRPGETQRHESSADRREVGRRQLLQIERDKDIKILVIRGAGRAFSTGYDLAGGWGDDSSKPFTIEDDHRILLRYIETLAAAARSAQAGYNDGSLAIVWRARRSFASARI